MHSALIVALGYVNMTLNLENRQSKDSCFPYLRKLGVVATWILRPVLKDNLCLLWSVLDPRSS